MPFFLYELIIKYNILIKLICFKFSKKIFNRNIEMILYIGVKFALYITFIFIFLGGKIRILFISIA